MTGSGGHASRHTQGTGRRRRQSWLAACMVVACIPHVCAGQEGDSELLHKVADAIKGAGVVHSGRGAAVLTREVDGNSTVRVMQFAFKGPWSRTEVFVDANRGISSREMAFVTNQTTYATLNPQAARIDPLETAWPFRGQIGLDYHPRSYEAVEGKPLGDAIHTLATWKGAKARMDGNGVLRIAASKKEPGGGVSSVEVTIDTNGYRLTAFSEDAKDLSGKGSRRLSATAVEWKRFDGQWYPESFTETQKETVVFHRGKPAEPRDASVITRGRIVSFEPNAALDDSEFAIAGLRPPAGTTIVDNVAGTIYKWGSPGVSEADLIRALDMPPRDGNVRVWQAAQAAGGDARIFRGIGGTEGGSQIASRRGWTGYVVPALVCIVLAAVAVGVVRMRRRVRGGGP